MLLSKVIIKIVLSQLKKNMYLCACVRVHMHAQLYVLSTIFTKRTGSDQFVQGSEWLSHRSRCSLGRLGQHLYRWKRSSDRHKEGFQAEAQQIGPHVNFIHHIIYREASASCDLEPKLQSEQWGGENCKLCKSSPINLSLTCSSV
jgi:hypothetical protein